MTAKDRLSTSPDLARCLTLFVMLSACHTTPPPTATASPSTTLESEENRQAASRAREQLVREVEPIIDRFQDHQLIAIGERHRRVEHARFLLAFMQALNCQHETYWLALEMPAHLQGRIDADMSGKSSDRQGLVYERGLLAVLDWVRSESRQCFRVVFIDRAVQPLRSDPDETRDQAMFRALRAIFTSAPDAKILAYLGAAHVLKGVEVREGGRRRDGSPFTVPTVPVVELLSRWGIRCYSLFLGGRDPDGLTDGLSELLWNAGEREFGILPLAGTHLGRQSGLLQLGRWYETAERAPLATVVDAIAYFPKLTVEGER